MEDNPVWEFNIFWSPTIPVIKSWSWTLAFFALELQDIRVFLYPPMETLAFTLAFTWWASFVAQLVKESACNVGRPGFNPWVGKIPLEKEKATHSSILAWRILWTEEPLGLQSMELQSQTQLSDWTCIFAVPCLERGELSRSLTSQEATGNTFLALRDPCIVLGD